MGNHEKLTEDGVHAQFLPGLCKDREMISMMYYTSSSFRLGLARPGRREEEEV